MPVRSLTSSVLRWPDKETVHSAVAAWTEELLRDRTDVVGVGYVGSYARGDWGVGSDVDLIVVVTGSPERFERRPLLFDATGLPVPADILVYTGHEWRTMQVRRPFSTDIVWIQRPD